MQNEELSLLVDELGNGTDIHTSVTIRCPDDLEMVGTWEAQAVAFLVSYGIFS